MVRPNLFLVGFQRCGSTTLFHLLLSHPKIAGTKPKETFALVDNNFEHFNPVNNVSNEQFSWAPYFEQVEGFKYFLEASVCNFYQKRALDYITSISDAKVIFIIRDPIERFISNFRYHGQGGIHLPPGIDINTYFDLIQRGEIHKEPLRYGVEHGLYTKYMRPWITRLGAENVLVTSLNNIRNDIDEESVRIYSFLGLEPIKSTLNIKENSSQQIKNQKLHAWLIKRFGGYNLQNTWAYSFYSQFNTTKKLKNVNLSSSVISSLKWTYADEYQNFSDKF